MVGQGCPHRSRAAPTWRRATWFATALVVSTTLLIGVRAATAQDATPEIGLRIAFGGGAPRLWRGSITIDAGEFSQTQLLGLEPDEPGSMGVGPRAITIRQPSPRSYDGLDVNVRAPLDAILRVRLAAADDMAAPRDFAFALRDLVVGVHPTGRDNPGKLDEFGNRLVVSRRPGDELRIAYQRDGLVFSPGDAFDFSIVPNLTGIEAGATLRMQVKILSRISGEEFYAREQDVKVDADGKLSTWGPHQFSLPPGDDVYELDVTVTRRTFLEPLAGVNPLASTKPVLQRRLQFVSIAASENPPGEASRLELVDEFDPSNNTNWAERVARLPLLRHMPRMKQGGLSHGEVTLRDHLGQRWTQLAAEAWQAHPLSISHVGAPHVLEVEYPNDVPQTLGVSLLETNAVGVVAPLGVDSAVEVLPLAAGEKPGVARQRLIFYPRTKTPVLLLTSLQPETPAVYGRVRLYRSTGPLAPRLSRSMAGERRVAAWLDKPLFPEMFSATEARDHSTTRSLDDWRTFYEGATRLTEYVSHVGYNAVVVPAWCEGSTLYPSKLLEPTPKYDTGIYLTAGQDPQRKDVLEVLFRVCDRQGLTLLPSLQFDAPLPELEQLARSDARHRVGLELVDHEGRTWLERNAAKSGLAPYYNPLDERVQQAMANVVRELAQRYGHHPSFGGVVLQLSPRGYALLPHAGWGFDDKTFASFAKAHGIADAALDDNRFAQRARYCTSTGRQQWLAWRGAQMTSLYGKLAAEVAAVKPEATLVLAGHDMLDSPALRHALRPTLQTKPATEAIVRDALLEIGIDGAAIEKQEGLLFVAPQPILPSSAGDAKVAWDDAASAQLQASLPKGGLLTFREPVTRRLATFDSVSPFGRENTFTWLAAQVAPSGAANRQRWIEGMAQGEHSLVLDGGWMLARGQEEELSDLLATLRYLPTSKPSVVATAGETPQPLLIKTYAGEGKTTALIANPTEWPMVVKLLITAAGRVDVTPLGPELKAPPLSIKRGEKAWVFELPAYGVVSGVFNQADVKLEVAEVHLPQTLEPQLVANLKEVRQRAAALKTPKAMPPIANAGYEDAAAADGGIAGWLFARGEGIEVKQAAGGHRDSAKALQVVSRGPEVWVRSQPIAAPRTGRIAVWVRLRTPTPNRQPELRLAIEARRGRQPYYRYATVGTSTGPRIEEQWAPFVLQIDDLPRDGFDEFRIGFDLMGPGEVWIDEIEVYDTSFNSDEQFRIAQQIAKADVHLRNGNLVVAARVLDGYWPRFLVKHVEPLPATEAETPTAADAPTGMPPTGDRETKRSWFRWVPSLF